MKSLEMIGAPTSGRASQGNGVGGGGLVRIAGGNRYSSVCVPTAVPHLHLAYYPFGDKEQETASWVLAFASEAGFVSS